MWEGARERDQRKRALEKLRDELLGPPHKPTKVRRPARIVSPVRPGQLFGLALPNGGEAQLRVIGLYSSRIGDFPIVELLNEHGQRYREWARWMVMSNVPQDDPGDSLRVIGEQPAPTTPASMPPNSLGWRALALECQQILERLR
jgi:hypothetical protein